LPLFITISSAASYSRAGEGLVKRGKSQVVAKGVGEEMADQTFDDVRSNWKKARFFILSFFSITVVLYTVFAGFLQPDHVNSTTPIPVNLTGYDYAYYILKPIPVTLLIILVALLAARRLADKRYALFIGLGLFWSLLGDIFLMFDGFAFFLVGLISFAVAHIFYIVAFCSKPAVAGGGEKLKVKGVLIIPFALYIAGILAVLLLQIISGYFSTAFNSSLFKSPSAVYAAPVAVYALIIGTMGWRAAARVGQFGSAERYKSQVLGVVGAVIFAVSDSLLSLNMFLIPIPYATAWVGITYWVGQCLITLSADNKVGFAYEESKKEDEKV